VPYGLSIALERTEAVVHASVAEARKRNWKMKVAVVDSGGNPVAFERMDSGCLPPSRLPNTSREQFRRPTKVFEDGI